MSLRAYGFMFRDTLGFFEGVSIVCTLSQRVFLGKRWYIQNANCSNDVVSNVQTYRSWVLTTMQWSFLINHHNYQLMNHYFTMAFNHQADYAITIITMIYNHYNYYSDYIYQLINLAIHHRQHRSAVDELFPTVDWEVLTSRHGRHPYHPWGWGFHRFPVVDERSIGIPWNPRKVRWSVGSRSCIQD